MADDLSIDELIGCGAELCQELMSRIDSVPGDYKQLQHDLHAQTGKLMDTLAELGRVYRKSKSAAE